MGLDQWIKYTDENGKEEEIYFRKVNFLRKFFEETTDLNEEDNYKEVEVPKEALQELKDRCKKVIANNDLADEILPTVSGFFFGSTNYDEWYFEDVSYVLEEISPILKGDCSDIKYMDWW